MNFLTRDELYQSNSYGNSPFLRFKMQDFSISLVQKQYIFLIMLFVFNLPPPWPPSTPPSITLMIFTGAPPPPWPPPGNNEILLYILILCTRLEFKRIKNALAAPSVWEKLLKYLEILVNVIYSQELSNEVWEWTQK